MKKILIINPNTAKKTAQDMEKICRQLALNSTHVDAICINENENFSSYKVFCYADLAICQVETIKLAYKNKDNYDGIIIAGFSDVGLDAIRELLTIPVLGIAETSYHLASMLSHRFSVLTGTSKWTPPKDDYIRALGLESRISSFRSYCEWDENDDFEALKNKIVDVAEKCINEDGAEAIVLGGGPLIGYGKVIEKIINIPVIDPTIATFKIMESLIDLGYSHSKIRKWKKPMTSLGDTSGSKSYNRKWLEK
jgi:allantoin racemase